MPSKSKKPLGPFSYRAKGILDEWLLTHEGVLENPKTYFSREELLNKIDYWLDNYPGITKERIFSNLNPGCVRNP